jgi:UDP-N-acetylmuramyl pentapeptide synthase
MKYFVKKIIVTILTWEAQLILRRTRPRIVAVTGNVGKTSTKEAIATVLATRYRVRKSQKSYNSEFGVPLTIIGRSSAWNNPIAWFGNILYGLYVALWPRSYPEWLVLEVGADRPGDIRGLAAWLPVDVAVMTLTPKIPVHVEYFHSAERLVAEKASIAGGLKQGGVAILNADDSHFEYFKQKFSEQIAGTSGRIVTYGLDAQAAVQASNYHLTYTKKHRRNWPEGATFKVDYEGSSVPVRLEGVLGRQHVMSSLAAIAVGAVLELNLLQMAEALSYHEVIPGRFKLIEGIKDTLIIDDTYNSSPIAVEVALETLEALETSGRKIVVLGDMLELGEHTIPEHKRAGELAAQVADLIITVGPRSKFVAEAAKEKKFSLKKLLHFDDALTAGQKLQEIIKAGDIILIKGSQGMRMERAVEEIMAEPERKHVLLTRQYEGWVK